MWPETEGLRGSNEVGSCVYRYHERLHKEEINKVTLLFSDTFGRQNRNKNFLSMLWYARHKFQFVEIEHVFFVRGHSQNEADSMHSVIERASKNFPVYTPISILLMKLDRSCFYDFKKVARVLNNF